MGKTKAYPIFFREDDGYYLIYIPDFDVVSEVDELDIAKVIQVSRCLIKDICKLKKEKNIYGMNEVLMKYRVRQNSISSNKIQLVKYHWQLYRDIEHLSILKSVFHIAYWCVIKILKIKEKSVVTKVTNIAGGQK